MSACLVVEKTANQKIVSVEYSHIKNEVLNDLNILIKQ